MREREVLEVFEIGGNFDVDSNDAFPDTSMLFSQSLSEAESKSCAPALISNLLVRFEPLLVDEDTGRDALVSPSRTPADVDILPSI